MRYRLLTYHACELYLKFRWRLPNVGMEPKQYALTSYKWIIHLGRRNKGQAQKVIRYCQWMVWSSQRKNEKVLDLYEWRVLISKKFANGEEISRVSLTKAKQVGWLQVIQLMIMHSTLRLQSGSHPASMGKMEHVCYDSFAVLARTCPILYWRVRSRWKGWYRGGHIKERSWESMDVWGMVGQVWGWQTGADWYSAQNE